LIVEIGGTVGDIESLPFLEAIRQFRYHVGKKMSCTSPSRSCRSPLSGERKTSRPAQRTRTPRSVSTRCGALPHRAASAAEMKRKISTHATVPPMRLSSASMSKP
jgi:CTP synthase